MQKNEKPEFNIVKEEEKVLEFWRENNIFRKSVSAREGGKPFVFYEGPPTANGKPGIHHVLGRSFKDVIPRYKTMRGFWSWRRAGWDTHGLPVEIEVEKELGLKNKKEIEEYGIAKFNAKCRDSVWRYKEDWEKLTERMGFWIDMEDPYITYDPDYIENLWAIFKKFSDKGFLSEDFKVVPWCVRCGTAVSSHEVAQGYETVTDRSVTVEFRVKGRKNTSLLAWTTTPWTLPGNVALAVGEDIDYIVVNYKSDAILGSSSGKAGLKASEWSLVASGDYIIARDIFWRGIISNSFLSFELKVLVSDIDEKELDRDRIDFSKDPDGFFEKYEKRGKLKRIKGKDLVGLEYEPLFEVPELKSDKSYRVYSADFVNTEEGTGIVHTAVMYGIDDFELGTKEGLPKFHTVDETGRFVSSVSVVGGKKILSGKEKNKETEGAIIDHLKEKNFLFKEGGYEHEYPFCWRCKSPLLYYARHSWFINVTKKKKELVAGNKKINWIPEHIGGGRFGEWLANIKDWAVSRERYWGTPLPIWRCGKDGCDNTSVIGSLSELNKKRFGRSVEFSLMRHGESLSNKRHVASSWPETFENTLTEKGKKQVEDAAARLKGGGIDVIYSSDLTRTMQTAQIVADKLGLSVKTDERLREISFGGFNGESTEKYHNFFSFLRERLFKEPSGGEDWVDVRKRMWSFAQDIKKKHSGQKVLVVSHGLPSALLESTLRGVETSELLVWQEENELKNADVHKVDFPNWPFNSDGEIDLHRPYVDEVEIRCLRCDGKMLRIKELADVWFDSGAMPFAQSPAEVEYAKKATKNSLAEPLEGQFPADYISEGLDQTRGWFYTQHAVSTLLGKGLSYKNVVVSGTLLDGKGKKMSKSVGNIIDPWSVINKYGIDALRWYFFTVNAPGDDKSFNEQDAKERYHRFVMTVVNSLVFLETYWQDPNSFSGKYTEDVLDKWINSRLLEEIKGVTERMDKFDFVGSARRIDSLVQDISNWYIRRSRSRLQNSDNTPEKFTAQNTLWNILYELSSMLAPFTPFLAEIVYLRLKKLLPDSLPESVHLLYWPDGKRLKREEELEEGMFLVRDLASVALAERAREGIKVRQKLSMLALSKDDEKKIVGLEELLKEEVNVASVDSLEGIGVGEVRLDINITPELAREGVFREVVRAANNLRKQAGLIPKDKIKLYLEIKKIEGGPDDFSDIKEELKKETRASEVIFKKDDIEFEKSFIDNNWEVWVGIKKV